MNVWLLGLGAIPFFAEGGLLQSAVQGAPFMMALGFLLCALISYLLSGVNFAILVSKGVWHEDIRDFGSGNAGLSNMYRTYGRKGAALTLLGDVLKTCLAVGASMALAGYYGGYIALLFCVVGHSWPCYFHFRGGKGVLCAAVGILLTCPVVLLILLLIFLAMVGITRYISVGSITAAFFYPLVLYAFFRGVPHPVLIFSSLFVCVLVLFQHRSNIVRLRAGDERKFGEKEDKNAKKGGKIEKKGDRNGEKRVKKAENGKKKP